jgi:hypothetical protein
VFVILISANRFIFGVKGDVKNNLFFIDDLRVLFPAGHNVVVHNTDDKKQTYVSGKVYLFILAPVNLSM